MKSSISQTSISLAHTFLITIFVLLIHVNTVKADAKLIQQTCKSTPYFRECVAYLKSKPGSSEADVRGLALIMVGIVKDKATATQSFINHLLRKHLNLKTPLRNCAELYDTILTADIPEAIEALEKGAPKFAQDGMRDGANAPGSCEEGFHGGRSPLSIYNKVVHVSSSIAAAIIQLLL